MYVYMYYNHAHFRYWHVHNDTEKSHGHKLGYRNLFAYQAKDLCG